MRRDANRIFFAVLFLVVGFIGPTQAQTFSPRQIIAQCWQLGAWNSFLMHQCTGGLFVDTATFHICMTGGPCFGEPPLGFGGRMPFCGSMNQPPCPNPRPCGHPDTISCHPQFGLPAAPACGVAPFPPCRIGLPCGVPGGLQCANSAPPMLPMIDTTLSVNLPGHFASLPQGVRPGVQFARPPLPEESRLRECRNRSVTENDFYGCLVHRAMPQDYRLAEHCLRANRHDGGRAFVCSTGNRDLQIIYDRVVELHECTERAGGDQWLLSQCLGNAVLGPNERYYLGCVTQNRGDMKSAAVCALGSKLNPEQQIALSCAISTSGNPKAFAICTGGRLFEREITKCWQNGIATSNGCFGPNNEYRRFLRNVDAEMRRALGENSVAYQAYRYWQDNVLAPGANHEVIRHLNNGLRDLREGPGPNNEILRAGRAVEGAVRSIGKRLGF